MATNITTLPCPVMIHWLFNHCAKIRWFDQQNNLNTGKNSSFMQCLHSCLQYLPTWDLWSSTDPSVSLTVHCPAQQVLSIKNFEILFSNISSLEIFIFVIFKNEIVLLIILREMVMELIFFEKFYFNKLNLLKTYCFLPLLR